MRVGVMVLVGLLASGCAQDVRPFTDTFSAQTARLVVGTVDRGDVSYVGSGSEAIEVVGQSIGRGSTKNKACKRRQGNSFSMDYDEGDGLLRFEATSEFKLADVHFEIDGPPVVDTDIQVTRGEVSLQEVQGNHIITASSIYTRDLIGNVDLLATSGGLDVEIFPYDNGDVYIDSTSGSAMLWLPFGGDYDLQVYFDPDYEARFEDLGWDWTWLEPGFFGATVGEGSITVIVHVDNGSFDLMEAF